MAGMAETLVALGRRMAWRTDTCSRPSATRTSTRSGGSQGSARGERIRLEVSRHGTHSRFRDTATLLEELGDFDLMPVVEVRLIDLIGLWEGCYAPPFYNVVFREEDTVEPVETGTAFDLQDYYAARRYRSKFERFAPYLTAVVNCIFWEARYLTRSPRSGCATLSGSHRLRVIGDISADLEARSSARCASPSRESSSSTIRFPTPPPEWGGVCSGDVVDILPSELPRDASVYFSGVLKEYIPVLARGLFSPFERLICRRRSEER